VVIKLTLSSKDKNFKVSTSEDDKMLPVVVNALSSIRS
jgi:hypothetical protein